MRLLLTAHATAGHTNGLRAIARRLLARGHSVDFAIASARLPFERLWPGPVRVASALPSQIAADGCRLVPLAPSPAMIWDAARLPRTRGYDELTIALRLFTRGLERHARTMAGHARASGAAAIVADYLMPAAWLAARMARVPFVAFYHSALPFPSPAHAPFGSGLRDDAPRDARWREAEQRLDGLSTWLDARVASACRALGLAPWRPEALRSPCSPDLNLLATRAALEPGLEALEGPVEWVGPCLPDAQAVPDDEAVRTARAWAGHERVYVSLGTVFDGQPQVLARLLDALVADHRRILVSAGASYGALATRGDARVKVFPRVAQVPLLREVEVVVTHGGNNTVQETLAAGRPMIVLPFGGDQIANARRVERLGVGVALEEGGTDAASVAAAWARLEAMDAWARARRVAEHGVGDGAEAAASAIERCIARSR